MHGQTYQSHAMVCAAALEVYNIIQQERLLENVKARGKQLEKSLKQGLAAHPNVGDIRGRGLFWGVSGFIAIAIHTESSSIRSNSFEIRVLRRLSIPNWE